MMMMVVVMVVTLVVTLVAISDLGDPGEPSYPVIAKIKEVIVGDPGINYNCQGDPIVIIPDNGAKLEYECDPFGKIRKVNVIDPEAQSQRDLQLRSIVRLVSMLGSYRLLMLFVTQSRMTHLS